MKINLEKDCGLQITVNTNTLEFHLGKDLNESRFYTRLLYDLFPVWANPVPEPNRVIYRYTAGLSLAGDKEIWEKSNIIYGIAVFFPDIFSGEFNKSSGPYYPLIPPDRMAVTEIYTVLHGAGRFKLQKSTPPYKTIEDAVLVEARVGDTFVVPPDYDHLQINPGFEPLIFSYVVMDGMQGLFKPFKTTKGAIYNELADKFHFYGHVFNSDYEEELPLRVTKASDICQLPFLNYYVNYQKIKDNLDQLGFLVSSERFPEDAKLGITNKRNLTREIKYDCKKKFTAFTSFTGTGML